MKATTVSADEKVCDKALAERENFGEATLDFLKVLVSLPRPMSNLVESLPR
jgi:hypothetical protein